MSRPACRSCSSLNVSSIGALPDGLSFAGVIQPEPLPGGVLWRCEDCYFVFRHPLLPTARYEELYRNGSAQVWESELDRQDFRLVRQHMAEDTRGTNVLEIGCYTGKLLESLPKRYRLHGIELNTEAARIAASRGIEIVAGGAAELDGLSAKFDAIIACDVIEHLVNPLAFLEQLRAHLTVGGRVLISTGNSDAWLWRIFGTNYWYCSFPEHISFIGSRWLQAMLGRVGLKVTRMIAFNYLYPGLHPAAIQTLARAALYGCSPGFYRKLRRSLRSETAEDVAPPGCGATKDHVFCVMSAV